MDTKTMYDAYLFFSALGKSDQDFAEHLGMDFTDAQSYLRLQRATRKPGKLRRVIYQGQAVCSECNKAKPVDAFYKNKSKPCGLSPKCKACTYKYKPSPLDNDPETVAYKLQITTLGEIDEVKAIQHQLKTKIAALKVDLEATEHKHAQVTRALDTYHLDN
jgi:hypothetical protein